MEDKEKEKEKLLNELKQYLQSSLTACGSDGAPLKKFINKFREDWSLELGAYSLKLGHGKGTVGVLEMLKTLGGYVTISTQENGEAIIKPVPNNDTKGNIKIIDKTNKDLAKENERKKKMMALNPNQIPLGAKRPLTMPGKPIPKPLCKVFQKQNRPLPAKSLPRIIKASTSQAQKQRNDFGDMVSRHKITLNKKVYAKADVKLENASEQEITKKSKLQKENLSSGKSPTLLGSSDDEDFRLPLSQQSSKTSSQSVGSIVEDMNNYHFEDDEACPDQIEDKEEEEEDHDEEEEMDDETDDGFDEWDFDVEFNQQAVEIDNAECSNFIEKYSTLLVQLPEDIFRIIYLLRISKGICSNDELKKAYNAVYKTSLSSKELNRLLGCHSDWKIAMQSFSQGPYAHLFRIIKSLSSYTIQLVPTLTDAFVNPLIFTPRSSEQKKEADTSRRSTPVSTPSRRPTPLPTPQTERKVSPIDNAQRSSPPKPLDAKTKITSATHVQQQTISSSLAAESTKLRDEFAQIAVITYNYLKSVKAPVPLLQLCQRVAKISGHNFSQSLFLAYLHEYFTQSFEFLFQDNGVSVAAKENMLEVKELKNVLFLMNEKLDLKIGDRKKVVLESFYINVNDNNLKLKLKEEGEHLEELLSEYFDLIESNVDTPAEIVPDKTVVFKDDLNKLCRGKIVRLEGLYRAIVHDIDANCERFPSTERIFDLPANYHGWLLPPTMFRAQLPGTVSKAQLERLQHLHSTKSEFYVAIVGINRKGGYVVRLD